MSNNGYYTFVDKVGDSIYHRYVDANGKRRNEVVKNFEYELFLPDPNGTEVSLYGDKLSRHTFNSIYEMREFVEGYKSYVKIFGNQSPVHQFIAKTYPDEIKMTNSNYVVLNFDIEVEHANGFPEPRYAQQEILSISCKVFGRDERITFGTKKSKRKPHKDSKYVECNNERSLMNYFLQYWQDTSPDIVTGWNIDGFDIPYIVNRIKNIMDDSEVRRLSPFGAYTKSCLRLKDDGLVYEYTILGITSFDYINLYKKYSPKKQESYKLDFVANYELDSRKVDYSIWGGSLMRLYDGEYDVSPETKPETLEESHRYARLRTIMKKRTGRETWKYTA